MRYLDIDHDAPLPSGHTVVEAEIEFLTHAGAGDMVVRGARLCAWAERFWHGRGWSYQILQSPVKRLQVYCPEISAPGARQLLADLPGLEPVVLKASSRRDILNKLSPSDLWRGAPSLDHAAVWLLWLEVQSLPASADPLLRAQASFWHAQAEDKIAPLYAPINAAEAREFLDRWLGISASLGPTTELPAFPVEIPERWQDRIEEAWRIRTVEQHGLHFREIFFRQLPRELKERAAKIGSDYFQYHPAELQSAVVQELAEFLPYEAVQTLRKIVPPHAPDLPPDTVEAVMTWFSTAYLPYRTWAVTQEDEKVKAHCAKLGTAFAHWVLQTYPKVLANGDGVLCFRRSGQKMMQKRTNEVTLLIILDGIGVWDAEKLIQLLRQDQKRLKLTKKDLCFAALPTVTAICKPALRQGVAPCKVTPNTYALADHSVRLLENEDAAEVLEDAEAGEFYIWSIVQTDKTYHQQADLQTIRDNVQGVLTTISKRIAAAVQAVPDDARLDVIVTTDHGRFLGRSKRTIPLPSGMESHQRAAWGPCHMNNQAGDFEIVADGRAARLHPERFGLLQPALVALGEDAFVNNDHSGGTDAFPHGGVWPEEVIIPWLEFQRDAEPLRVEGRVSGSAVEGGDGQLEIHLVNGGSLEVEILSLSLAGIDRTITIPIHQTLPAHDAKVIARPLHPWPTAAGVATCTATVSLKQPTGETVSSPLAVSLESESFQRRNAQLDDLL